MRNNFLMAWVMTLSACASPEARVLEVFSLLNWYPSGNATCIPTDTGIWVTFSEPLVESSLNDATVVLSAGETEVEKTISYTAKTSTVAISPTRNLDYNREYVLRLDAQITAAGGDELGVELTNTFSTVPQQGCSDALECLVDSACTPQVCSVVGVCVDECAVPDDCGNGQTCVGGSCQ